MSNSGNNRRRFRFPVSRRLRQSRDFERVRTEGRTLRGKLLILGVLELEGELAFKIGLVTSKRIGGAVVRNRLRRRLREIVRRDQARLRNGFWLVLVARPSAGRVDYASLEQEWSRLLERAEII